VERKPAKEFQDLILANDLGYGETTERLRQLEEISKLLEAYAGTILSSES